MPQSLTLHFLAKVAAAMAALSPALQPTEPAKPAPPTPAIDNFVHAPGTATSPLGQLGEVQKRGHGPVPMILIPGAPFDWTIWESFTTRNAERYTMYAVTPAGYGKTNPPPMPAKNEEFDGKEWTRGFCDAVAELITREHLDRPVLVGHHFMADTDALRIALDHPQQVRGVVIVAGRGSSQMPTMKRTPGEPIGPATHDERLMIVSSYMAPFYKTVDAKTWRSGSFKGSKFSRDASRGDALFEQEVAVPRPTQIRYMLEHMSTDINQELERLTVPVLVLDPEHGPITLDSILAENRELYESMYGSLDAARKAWGDRLVMMWGDLETGVKKMNDPSAQWEELAKRLPGLKIVRVPETGIFIMDDQPQKLDEHIATFVDTLNKAAAPAGAPAHR